MSALTQSAEGTGALKERGRKQAFSANAAKRAFQRTQRLQAISAHRKSGNANQRRTTDTAIGGKKRKEDAGSGALCPADESRICCLALGTTYSKAGTAEDNLPQPAKAKGLPQG
jgi:hypothetical protein